MTILTSAPTLSTMGQKSVAREPLICFVLEELRENSDHRLSPEQTMPGLQPPIEAQFTAEFSGRCAWPKHFFS